MRRFISWLNYLFFNQDGFFGLGQGPSNQEKTQYGNLSGIGSFATNLGESDVSAASNFWNAILSGDMSKIGKVLGPEISGIKSRAAQSKQTAGQFGNRSGGTNAGIQATDDTTRASINEMIDSLLGTAGSTVGSLGSSLLNTGLSATGAAFGAADVMHGQNASFWNDLFKSITSVGSSVFGGTTGDVFSGLGGP
jgi:hypothetical protein